MKRKDSNLSKGDSLTGFKYPVGEEGTVVLAESDGSKEGSSDMKEKKSFNGGVRNGAQQGSC